LIFVKGNGGFKSLSFERDYFDFAQVKGWILREWDTSSSMFIASFNIPSRICRAKSAGKTNSSMVKGL
jgi:hypothetical protein